MSLYAVPPEFDRDRLCSWAGLAAVAPYLAIAGAGISAIGAVNQGEAASKEALYEAQVNQNNATIAQQNAAYSVKAGEANAYAQGLQNRQQMGAAVAGLAAQGVDVNTGSAAKVREGQEETGYFNVENVRQQAALQAYGYQTQATGYQSEAQLLEAEAPADVEAGFLSAGGSLLSGLGSLGWQQALLGGSGGAANPLTIPGLYPSGAGYG